MKLIVGVSGASGVVMSRTLLDALSRAGCETHLVLTDAARRTWELEMESPIDVLLSMADRVYGSHDMAALISSGSFVTDGMIILPCSMKTLAGIVSRGRRVPEGKPPRGAMPARNAAGTGPPAQPSRRRRAWLRACSANADFLQRAADRAGADKPRRRQGAATIRNSQRGLCALGGVRQKPQLV